MPIPDWMVRPETIFAVVLFLFGVVVSVFSPEIRRLLSVPPRRWKGIKLSQMSYRLDLINRLNDNPYRLQLYFMWTIGKMVWQFILVCAPTAFIYPFLPASLGQPKRSLTLETFLMPVLGVLVGWVWHFSQTVRDLYYFEERKSYYEQMIVKLGGEPGVSKANVKTTEV